MRELLIEIGSLAQKATGIEGLRYGLPNRNRFRGLELRLIERLLAFGTEFTFPTAFEFHKNNEEYLRGLRINETTPKFYTHIPFVFDSVLNLAAVAFMTSSSPFYVSVGTCIKFTHNLLGPVVGEALATENIDQFD